MKLGAYKDQIAGEAAESCGSTYKKRGPKGPPGNSFDPAAKRLTNLSTAPGTSYYYQPWLNAAAGLHWLGNNPYRRRWAVR